MAEHGSGVLFFFYKVLLLVATSFVDEPLSCKQLECTEYPNGIKID